jgi:Kef-type K+ transport system membrane component KefB
MGCLILATATIDDIVSWISFALIVAHFSTVESRLSPPLTLLAIVILFMFVMTLGKRWAEKWMLWNDKNPNTDSLFLGIILVLILLTAALVESLGIHAILGGFLIGIAFSTTQAHRMHHAMQQLAVAFFAPLYFVAVGLQVNFAQHFDLSLVLLMIGIASLGKIGGVFIGARLSKLSIKESLGLSFAMNARGAVGIILATSAYQAHLINARIFVALIIMAMATTLLSMPFMKKMLMR